MTSLTFLFTKEGFAVEYDSQVVQLSQDFYSAYPSSSFPEILEKDSRPYNCLLVETHYDFYICLPYRTHIRHKYAFRFRNSRRSNANKSGIDYTKMVIIKDSSFISGAPSIVDQDEYRETMQNIHIIVNNAVSYLEDYIQHKSGTATMDQQEFHRRYACSSLSYFDALLGLS